MKSYLDYLPLAEHYQAIGQAENIYLSGSYGKTSEELDLYPYEHVTAITKGGSFRWNMPVDYGFTASVGGLSFRWSLYLEREGARASGVTKFDFDLFRAVAKRIPPEIRHEFTSLLTENMKLFDAQVQSARENYLGMVLHRNTLENVIGEILVDMAPESDEAVETVRKWSEDR